MATGDTLDLANIKFATATLSFSGGVLTVSDGTTTANITMVGAYTQANFHMAADAGSHTDVTYTGTPMNPIVVDTAANLSGATLNGLQANSTVTSILVSDSGLSNSGFIGTNVAQLTSDAGALAKLSYANGSPVIFRVSDTAINLSGAAMDLLQSKSAVKSIVVSDNGASNGGRVQVNVAQLTSDATALGEMVYADGTTTGHIRVADTAANVSAALDAIAANKHIGRISVTDNLALTVNVAQLTTDAAALAYSSPSNNGAVKSAVKVIDTAIDLSGAALDTMQANAAITTVTVSDNGASNGGFVSSNVAQLTSDASLLTKLAFANSQIAGTLNVTDTAAAISGDLSALNGDTQVGRITISDNASIALNVAAYNGDTVAIPELRNANSNAVLFNVGDTAANLGGASLHNLINAGDAIDATNINFATLTATFTENGAGTAGTLNLTDGNPHRGGHLVRPVCGGGFLRHSGGGGLQLGDRRGYGLQADLAGHRPRLSWRGSYRRRLGFCSVMLGGAFRRRPA